MKFSYNWLREYVEGLELSPLKLEGLITMKTAECEGIETYGLPLGNACTARVDSVEPLAGTHNVKVRVVTGRYGEKTVVCGAPNCRVGLVTAYAPLGKKVINGVESDGMLASGAELGLNRDHAGIIELESQVGAPIPGCGPDSVIEIDNKSITHRPDLWGHFGMAREVAAISGGRLLDPVKMNLLPKGKCPINIAIQDFELCLRYSALVFESVTVGPSPLWLQYRLSAIGLNPINNIVDLTNYIMAELAQPMHAFDRDLLLGDTIFIRTAQKGEHIVALNEEKYALKPSNLVIADKSGPIAIAGVIGGLASAIGNKTTNIVFESANFQAASIRKTSVDIKLRTDASMRFEKSQDPNNTVRALARAVELMPEIAPGSRLVGGLGDEKKEIPAPSEVALEVDWVIRRLGRTVSEAEMRDILERLEFGVRDVAPRVFSVTIPSWRAAKDVSLKDDLVEEVGRMMGYDTIQPQPPAVLAAVQHPDETRTFHRAARATFAAQGFTEVYNYSFISEELAQMFGFDPDDHVRVANPIASGQTLMRRSLVPGVYRNVVENSKHFERFRFFEIGREIHKQPKGLPREIPHLLAVAYSKDPSAENLFELKQVAECLMPAAEVRPAMARCFEHPARAAEVKWQGQVAGRLFELHPNLFELHPKMLEGRAALLDLDLALIQELRPREKRYVPLRRYPSSQFDLSVIAATRELVADLESKLAGFAGQLLERIEYVRQYSGPPLEENLKSVSFRLTVGSTERTLSSEDAGAIRARIIDGMRGLGYELRV
ncbi:MAG: phenylalanine--tRNA ligase subunit beta [Acidobacteria bacterium]|nr:MAG: phenylalanine--tRNA ligase subunit beta [Acidobacteriota bacterium]